MGSCREPVGRAWTESRRESFYLGSEERVSGVEGDTQTEFHYRDLPDVIAALIDLRDNEPDGTVEFGKPEVT